MENITKKTIEYLANLARIKLTEIEKETLSADLKKIINHFNELNNVDTSNVKPITEEADLKNILRKDDENQNPYLNKGIENFPETKNGFLKVPKVL